MIIKRQTIAHLEHWKSKENRKPLIVRGARQVGKTTLISNFSASYAHKIMLNLERPNDLRWFQEYPDARTIAEALCLSYNIPVDQRKNTLLFIDEIQESSEAIAMLRYFYEDVPDMHLIAAGSLLEQAMGKVKSFPVGRVEYLYMFPVNFIEYVEAMQKKLLLEQIHSIPVSDTAHLPLNDLFREYAIIGGMPEVIARRMQAGSIADISAIYEGMWSTYKSDVEKYAHNTSEARVIRHIMSTAHVYLDNRIKLENFGQSHYSAREVGEAMRNLGDAQIIQLIYPTTNTTLPAIPNLKKSPRLQFLDTGLVNYALGIQADMLSLGDLHAAHRGAVIPHLVNQEIMSLNSQREDSYKPMFWVREKSQSSAEVDIVIQYKSMLIPIEIKSGTVGTLRSLHQFVERTDHHYAIRMYAGTFSIEKHFSPTQRKPYFLMNLPYYLGTKIFEYLDYFTSEY